MNTVIHHDQCIPGMQRWFSTRKSISVICHINKVSKDYHTITLVYAEKALDRFQYLLMTKTLRKPGTEGNFISSMKNIYKKPIASSILNTIVPPSVLSLSADPRHL